MYKPIRNIMKCYNCGERKTKTIYPKYKIKSSDKKYTQFVQKWCIVCNWKSYPIEVVKLE